MITGNSIAAQSESTVNNRGRAANARFINLSGGINICFMTDLWKSNQLGELLGTLGEHWVTVKQQPDSLNTHFDFYFLSAAYV